MPTADLDAELDAGLGDAVRAVDPDTGLRAVARLRRLVEQLEAEQVAAARRAGWSWREIAVRLGVTKQTVHRKYHRTDES
ncbi:MULTISPECIES: helix-turn-helix domain-containing protein [unclassified Pseudofrankia]|uniref:helix-turn-helix domain-containing protein n=1 Tax=unclassified Pseudofrankia TaxID=2994372 RepID=UPI0009F50FC7|nr:MULTISPECIES: helix-turn-helix domain-containing protein [unclassified Pseudofrankia]MDT3445160.1 helix-turn-helix domain-containing protein [Pseudofrankia sp. BMG5.37]